MRTAQKKYYEHWRVCDDASCALRTQATRVGAPERCPARGCRGRLVDEYGAKALYVQLKYLESLFDTGAGVGAAAGGDKAAAAAAASVAAALPAEHRAIHELLRAQVSATLARSGYNWVSSSVFATSAAVKESTELRDAGEKKPDAAEAATAMDTEAEGVEYALWDAPAAAHHTAALRALAAGV